MVIISLTDFMKWNHVFLQRFCDERSHQGLAVHNQTLA